MQVKSNFWKRHQSIFDESYITTWLAVKLNDLTQDFTNSIKRSSCFIWRSQGKSSLNCGSDSFPIMWAMQAMTSNSCPVSSSNLLLSSLKQNIKTFTALTILNSAIREWKSSRSTLTPVVAYSMKQSDQCVREMRRISCLSAVGVSAVVHRHKSSYFIWLYMTNELWLLPQLIRLSCMW